MIMMAEQGIVKPEKYESAPVPASCPMRFLVLCSLWLALQDLLWEVNL